jgi:predicted RNase H-like nuclease (RuvC/YqgF family)
VRYLTRGVLQKARFIAAKRETLNGLHKGKANMQSDNSCSTTAGLEAGRASSAGNTFDTTVSASSTQRSLRARTKEPTAFKANVSALESQLAAQTARAVALEAQLNGGSAYRSRAIRTKEPAGLQAKVSALESQLAAQTTRMVSLEAQLEDMREQRKHFLSMFAIEDEGPLAMESVNDYLLQVLTVTSAALGGDTQRDVLGNCKALVKELDMVIAERDQLVEALEEKMRVDEQTKIETPSMEKMLKLIEHTVELEERYADALDSADEFEKTVNELQSKLQEALDRASKADKKVLQLQTKYKRALDDAAKADHAVSKEQHECALLRGANAKAEFRASELQRTCDTALYRASQAELKAAALEGDYTAARTFYAQDLQRFQAEISTTRMHAVCT